VVSFLDVGQGDAIYIKTPEGVEMLVDGGVGPVVLRALASERLFFDRTIELMVATHPDLDHIGGLVDVLKRYQVTTILETENLNDTPAAKAYNTAVIKEEANRILVEAGQVIALSPSTQLQIFSPTGDETNWESNTASIVMRVVYGNTAVMLTGDAPSGIEEYLVSEYQGQLKSDILKLGHHGSKTSTSELFLEAVSPRYAVVSAGSDNRYGHPHQEVMDRVLARNIEVSQTGTHGTITYLSDGDKVWIK
jgi:competence protein ComEC